MLISRKTIKNMIKVWRQPNKISYAAIQMQKYGFKGKGFKVSCKAGMGSGSFLSNQLLRLFFT